MSGIFEKCPENETYQWTYKENLNTQSHRKADNSKFYPLKKPIRCDSIMYESRKKSNNRNDLTYGKTLNGQDCKNGR